MISEALKKAIYVSIPSTVTMGTDNITIKREYANRMTYPVASTDHPVTTLNYFADTKDLRSSSLNGIVALELTAVDGSGNQDIITTFGKRKRVSLSLHCMAIDKTVGANKYHRNDIVFQMIRDLEIWAMRDLQVVLDTYHAVIMDEGTIPKLEMLQGESVAHGVFDIVLLYPFETTKQDITIEDISGNVADGYPV